MKKQAAGLAAVITILNGLCLASAGAETVGTLTKGQSNPIVRGIYALPEAAVEGARDLLPAL